MRRRTGTIVRFAAVLMVTVAVLSTASAFAAQSQGPGLGSFEVQYWMEDEPGSAVAIISVRLDDSVELPATVQIPVPDGMTVEWAGEISDTGSVEDDIQRQHALKSGTNGSYAEFELTTYRVGQIDLGAVPISASTQKVSGEFEYVQSVPSSVTAFSVRLPSLASDPQIQPAPTGPPSFNDIGQSLYTLPSKAMGTGESQAVTVSYAVDAGGEQGGGPGPINVLLWALAAGVVVTAGVLLWLVSKQRANPMGGAGSIDDDGEYGSEPTSATSSEDADDQFTVDE